MNAIQDRERVIKTLERENLKEKKEDKRQMWLSCVDNKIQILRKQEDSRNKMRKHILLQTQKKKEQELIRTLRNKDQMVFFLTFFLLFCAKYHRRIQSLNEVIKEKGRNFGSFLSRNRSVCHL